MERRYVRRRFVRRRFRIENPYYRAIRIRRNREYFMYGHLGPTVRELLLF